MSTKPTYKTVTPLTLGTGTGSTCNYIRSGFVAATKPTIGMGATILMWTDRRAVTVIEVSLDAKRLVVQEDVATRIDSNGLSESQSCTVLI